MTLSNGVEALLCGALTVALLGCTAPQKVAEPTAVERVERPARPSSVLAAAQAWIDEQPTDQAGELAVERFSRDGDRVRVLVTGPEPDRESVGWLLTLRLREEGWMIESAERANSTWGWPVF